ncbi:ammonium transporter [Kyrpidia sp.]|uniref:ammonium transporter n=1 Tax=Kyrpidia sp. TaxID=2073077 RepID=UPI00258B0F47|nr:ammonium transporter [Kyrpidia sp.]MCL6575574.1 ammonium transporter [Kyrpidia sp.]
MIKWARWGFLPALVLLVPSVVLAADPTVKDVAQAVDTVWVAVTAFLVFFMQAGFALLEAGSTRMKNAGHIAGKNILSFGLAALVFWAVGFAISFGQGNAFVGTQGWFLNVSDDMVNQVFGSLSYSDVPLGAKYMFEVVFAGVSLAIFWGGIAERAKLIVYFIFGILFSALIYPVVAHWIWGGGWLSGLGMQDFAGSTVVHLQGGVAALVGAMLLGPRIGKYGKDGSVHSLPGHNTVYSVLGVIILWFGWFGFNPGSTLSALNVSFAYIAMTTNLAAAAGGVAALLTAWAVLGKPDIPMMLNGVLAALVAITASCAFVEPWAAVVIGAVAGVVMVLSVQFFERVARVDDPVGAFSVHGVAGIWGTLSTGFFASPDLVKSVGVGAPGLFYGGGLHQLGVQAAGVLAAGVYVFVVSFIILYAIKATVGLRISREEEIIGLDVSEHGASGYPEQLPHGGEFSQGGSSGTRATPTA